MISYLTISSLVNALSSITLALLIYSKNPESRLSRSFCLFCLFVALWSIPYFFWQLATTGEQALLLCRMLMAGAALIPVSLHYFVSELTRSDHRSLIRYGYWVGALFAFLSLFTPYVVAGVEEKLIFPFWPVPGWLFYPFMVNFLFYSVISFIALIRFYKKAEPRRKKQIQFVVYGLVLCYSGGLTNFFLWFDVPVTPFGNGLVAVYVVAVGYSIMKFRLMEVDLILLKGLCYASFILVVALLLSTGIYFFGYPGDQEEGRNNYQMLTAFLISVLMVSVLFWLLPAFKRGVEGFVEGNLLRDRFSYRNELKEFTRKIGELPNEKNIFKEIVDFVSRNMDIGRISFFYKAPLESAYTCRAQAGDYVEEIRKITFDPEHPLPELLKEKGTFLLGDELREELAAGSKSTTAPRIDEKLPVSAVIPVHHHDHLLGFLFLGETRGKQGYTDIDLSLLESLCIQVALVFMARDLERKANQADRLISLGTFAASMAHEIRNPLVSIQTFVSLMGEQKEHPHFREKLHKVMERDVNRIATIVENIGCLSENGTGNFSNLDLTAALETSIEISHKELQTKGINISLSKPERPMVAGDYNQLVQVFLNLIQNAADAIEDTPDPSIEIRVHHRRLGGDNRAVIVEVSDNGPGIDGTVLSNIFDPFVSTKNTGDINRKRGMGLGLSIVKRIIDSHHGEISVTSERGKGTSFRITLPATK